MVKSNTQHPNEYAKNEGFSSDVLGQGIRRASTSGDPRPNVLTPPNERHVDQFDDSDSLSETALMECYNG
jgi:hypothetical protein